MRLDRKLMSIGAAVTIAPLLAAGVVAWIQNRELKGVAKRVELEHTVESVYSMCDSANGMLSRDQDLLATLVQRAGGLHFAPGEMARWDAVNQQTQAVEHVSLPKAYLGKQWLGTEKSFGVHLPVLDEMTASTGTTATIFERMNEQGDMLRIATTVPQADGRRATGTYIAARNSDGSSNPVIREVLGGATFAGRAYVVNGWYLTNYRPIYDRGRAVGMLYAGTPEARALAPLRKKLLSMQIGKTGYVFMLNATGAARGHYVLSKGGQRDGEDIWNSRDTSGHYFIQEICTRAVKLKPAEVAAEHYPWANSGEPVQPTVTYFAYFKPWDLVLAAAMPEDEYVDSTSTLERVTNQGETMMLCLIAFGGLAAIFVWYLVSRRLMAGIGDGSRRLRDCSAQLLAAAQQVAANSTHVAGAAEQSAAGTEQVSASVQQLSAGTEHNRAACSEAASLTHDATAQARRGLQGMHAAVTVMDNLQKSSAEIGRIVKTIDDVAFQTNILALNASIEAARAGVAGAGFAVVADEVRALAQKSAEAARLTAGKVEASVRGSEEAASATMQLKDVFTSIAASVERVDSTVEIVAGNAAEQQGHLEQIRSAMQQVQGAAETTAANAEQAASASEQLSAQAAEVNALAGEMLSLIGL